MDNNKLIADFMGNEVKHGKCYSPKNNDGTIAPMQFDRSWDWLMPVLDKIKEMRCLPDDHDESFSWVCKSSDIEAEYNAVVEFINEHNKYICGSCVDHANEVVFNEDTDVDECTNCIQ